MLDRLGEWIDKNPCFAMAITLFVGGALGVILVACDCQSETTASSETVEELNVEKANGCPLDAIAYDTPAFANSWNDAYKVTDRFSGASWWLVKMGRSWVALPIESEETANVG